MTPSTSPPRRANVAWAFAAADVNAPELFDSIAETALTQGERFNSQDLANLAQAFSNARRVSPKLFDFIAKTCLQRGLGAFNSQDLANTAFAFGTAGHASRELFDAIGEAAPRSIGSFTGQGLANTLWAYCVLGVDAPAFFTAAAEALPSHIDALSKDFAASSQLYQVFLYLQIESPHQRLLPVLAEHRQIWLDAFWNDSIRPSQSQLGVSHALNVLGWEHEDELRTEDGLSLDMANSSTKTVVEFDGPTHYLQGPDGPSLDGRTHFKRRLLARLGWTCAAVPYFEWDPLLASGATEPYLRGVLARLRSE